MPLDEEQMLLLKEPVISYAIIQLLKDYEEEALRRTLDVIDPKMDASEYKLEHQSRVVRKNTIHEVVTHVELQLLATSNFKPMEEGV